MSASIHLFSSLSSAGLLPHQEQSGVKRKASDHNTSIAKRRRVLPDFDSIFFLATFGGPFRFTQPLPLAIIHPVFAQFIEESNTYATTASDNALLRDLRELTSMAHNLERNYSNEFRDVLRRHYKDVELDVSKVRMKPYITDGLFSMGKFLTDAHKGRRGNDLEEEGTGYLITSLPHSFESTRDVPDEFPCVFIYIYGECLAQP
jgi:hypothetical protein